MTVLLLGSGRSRGSLSPPRRRLVPGGTDAGIGSRVVL
jgi:hypothetical protein